MKTVTVKLPLELNKRLDTVAARLKKTKSVLIRLAIQELLQQPDIASKVSAYEVLADYCGVVNGMPSDLSSSKSYLEGYGR